MRKKAYSKTKLKMDGTPKGCRPSEYTQKVGSMICQRLAEGESLSSISKDPRTPAMSTIFLWLTKHPDFLKQYNRAREEQAEAMADEIVGIADGNGAEDNAVMTARDRLRVDARKWVAAKLKPKKYGDKMQNEISGPDGGPIEHKYSDWTEERLSEEIAKRAAALHKP